jgi:hypothetical protein
MGISKRMNQKLAFPGPVQQKIMGLLSRIDTFEGIWKMSEQRKSGYLKELRKIAIIESSADHLHALKNLC